MDDYFSEICKIWILRKWIIVSLRSLRFEEITCIAHKLCTIRINSVVSNEQNLKQLKTKIA